MSSSRPPSWSGTLGKEDSEDISLQDFSIHPSNSASSVAGLLRDDPKRQTSVYKGVKHLFLGDSANRRKSDVGTSNAQRPELGARSNSTPGDVEVPSNADLLHPQSLNAVQQGLTEALGSEGKGSWLSVEDDEPVEEESMHEYRPDVEEGLEPPRSPASPSSPARNLSTMVQDFSSRVVSTHRSSEVERDKEEEEPLEEHLEPVEPEVLCGKSLMLFPPHSKLRKQCYKASRSPLVEPCILTLIVLHTVILSYVNGPNIFDHDVFPKWGAWPDWVLLIVFIIYTAESVVKIIAFGLWDDSQLILDDDGFVKNVKRSFGLFQGPKPGHRKQAPVVLKTFTSLMTNKERHQARVERAYLRSSWNRVDFLSVVCFWLSLILNLTGVENKNKFFALRMLSSLRILRLLNLTRGTSAVLRALKKGAPLLTNVAVFIFFFWMLFSIIGVQSFKSSLRRRCVWIDPEGIQSNYTTENYCGSHLHPETYKIEPYVFTDGSKGMQAKGYTCPANSLCVSDENPYGGTLSFDNVFNSFQIVFVVMSANTFTDMMYNITNTDYLAAALYFMFGIVVLYIWLMNLLIAVIASSFKLVQEELSAEGTVTKLIGSMFGRDHKKHLLRTKFGKLYDKFRWVWTLLIAADVAVQCSLTSESSKSQIEFIYGWQVMTTAVLLVEIVIRFVLYFPCWRAFFRSKSNVIDSFLAVANLVVILPFVHDHEELYAWMTVFQVARFYRVAISIPFARDLWSKVLGNYKTIFNLTVFFFLMCFLSSVLAAQLFRGVVPYKDDEGEVSDVSFFDLANSFVGLFQITSTENWTDVMYPAIENAPSILLRICFGMFFVLWYILSNFIILNLFIAVITENLDVSPEVKRKAQIKAFVKEYAAKLTTTDYLTDGLKLVKGFVRRKRGKQQSGEDVFDMLLERHVVEEFLDNEEDLKEEQEEAWYSPLSRRIKDMIFKRRPENPFLEEHEMVEQSKAHPTNLAQEFLHSQSERAKLREEYLAKNPNFDKSVYIFKPTNKLRRWCQSIVASSHGTRSTGINPKPAVWYSFSAIMLVFTIALVVVACINTPLYYREYVVKHGFTSNNWITYVDFVFACVFTGEAGIKVIADGLWFTPNGYARSSWNKIDFLVLISLWINFVSEAFFNGYVSRFVRCFQALRALRLLSVSATAQQTFHSVIIVGIGKIFGAALLSLCLLFPYTIWGLNIFNGRLSKCNDDDIEKFSNCVGEFQSSPFNWDMLAPRVVERPYYHYDSFGHALLVQFGIISYEGWIDLLFATMSITGRDTNPEPNASRYNGIFAILYNFLSSIFILSMFVAVIIRNYSETRGTAYLTDDQLAWYEIEKILKLARPSIRPPTRTPGTIRHYLLRKVQDKKSWVYVMEKALLGLLIIFLCVEYYPSPSQVETMRMVMLTIITLVYECVFIAKVYTLGFRIFLRKRWEVYGILVCTGAFITTLVGIVGKWNDLFYNFQKLTIVGMVLLWIPKSTRLDQLFKTASASFIQLGNLLITWFILFLAYAIAYNQVFGLTRLGENTDNNVNFRTVPKALILLFRTSFGEGWNELMEDFLVGPPECVSGTGFTDTDCGSAAYAYILFITWNILSMYIFVNMFISLIYEHFSYVFHKASSEISKEDIRKYKEGWLRFDPQGTGYIAKEDLHRFLRTTEGYFSFGIYTGSHSVKNILHAAKIERDPEDPYHVDVAALNDSLRQIPGGYYKHKRKIYDMFCTQAILEAHPTKGIGFNTLMRQFPFYKTMDDTKCLKLDDYLKRKLLLQKIEIEMLKSKLKGFLSMVYEQQRVKHPPPLRAVLPVISVSDIEPRTPSESVFDTGSIQDSPGRNIT